MNIAALLTLCLACLQVPLNPPASKTGDPSATVALTSSFAGMPVPDEGMWTYDNLPLKTLKERYGFEPSKAWIDHARLASVRVSSGGSGSFVSPKGLVMTNHHVALEFINGLSTPERDLVTNGFHARSHEEELKVKGNIRQLTFMRDVTKPVEKAAEGESDASKAGALRAGALAKLKAEIAAETKLDIEMVTLYGGGQYMAYGYKVWDDLRLVFAPEMRAAYYGGDDDNFVYPRWCLDLSFLRAYENGKPADTAAHYLKWSAKGPAKDELVFVSGNPGSTARLWPVSRLEHERNVYNPIVLALLVEREKALSRFAELGEKERLAVLDELFGVRNSLKSYTGSQAGLTDPKLWARKVQSEAQFLEAAGDDADVKEAMETYSRARKMRDAVFKELIFLRLDGQLGTQARQLARYALAMRRAEDKRPAAYRGPALEKTRQGILRQRDIDPRLAMERLTANFTNARDYLGKDHEYVAAAMGEIEPAKAAADAVNRTVLRNADKLSALLSGDPSGILQSKDRLLRAAVVVEQMRGVPAGMWSQAGALEAEAGATLSKARFRLFGSSRYPDATFTLRLAYGTCKGYEQGTTRVPWYTTFFGLFGRHASFQGKKPFDLPKRWLEARDRMDLSTPYNFVSTCDIVGGNSGSPVFNRKLEVVGLIFDGNIQSLPNRYMYLEERCRSTSVHSEGIKHTLEVVYKAYGILAELGVR